MLRFLQIYLMFNDAFNTSIALRIISIYIIWQNWNIFKKYLDYV